MWKTSQCFKSSPRRNTYPFKMRYFGLILVVFLASVATSLARQRKGVSDESDREGKLFSLFTIVNFKNEACISTSSLSSGSTSYRNGTCYTTSECESKGGSAKGNCASGFGVCCVFLYSSTSQTTVSYNDTYLQNPNFPSTYGEQTSVSYTINKCSSDVCFLRLDFETFQTQGPGRTDEDISMTPSPECVDKMTVTVQSGQTIPTLCGQLTGQHIYLDLGTGSSDSATLALAFSGASTQRKWDIKVAQIPCGTNYAPPGGCLQWHTGYTGKITTFNFEDSTSAHLINQNYAACVRQEAGMCCVEYSVCGTGVDQFSLDNEKDVSTDATMAESVIGTSCYTATTAGGTDFSGDYIVIDGSGGTCGDIDGSRYCGQRLNPIAAAKSSVPICDCTAPFSVGIVTDGGKDTTSDKSANRGACLNYRQLPCSGST